MRNLLTILFLFNFSLSCVAGEPDAEIIHYISHVQIIKNKLIREDTIVLQINKRMGDDMAYIQIPYTKGENLNIGEARIENSSGEVVRKLKKSEIKDLSAISRYSLYEDDFVKTFELKHNEYPYRVIYSFKRVSSGFLYIASFTPHSLYPVRNMKLTVEVPADYPLKHKEIHTGPPKITNTQEVTIFEWHTYYDPFKREEGAPLSAMEMPHIYVLPLDFNYGKQGSWRSWKDFGNWIYLLNERARDLPESEKTKINTLLTGISDKEEIVRRLYYYMQENTRYVNVKIDVGGLKSYPASYVVTNKYGDCKALCNYLQAMLEYAGIESFYTLVMAGDEIPDIHKDFPYQAFNHVILTVPLEQDILFLECTAKNIPAGYLGSFTQGRDGFIIQKDNSHFIRTPFLQPENVKCERKIHVPLQKGISMVTIDIQQRGDAYQEASFLFASMNRSRMEKYIRNYWNFGTMNVQSLDFKQDNRDIAEIDIAVTVTIKDIYKQYGNDLILTSFPWELPVYEIPEKRTQELRFDIPICMVDTIVYDLGTLAPAGIASPEISLVSSFGEYTVTYTKRDNLLVVSKFLLINRGSYPLSEYNAFHEFISEIKNNEKKAVYLHKL
ncbi:MAG: DUF3857 domain-containing protein [Candidatus Azobacteroides sp.]|nr:DUF3857 domain-containing protein [Candidatus Azobacteroides sp.]